MSEVAAGNITSQSLTVAVCCNVCVAVCVVQCAAIRELGYSRKHHQPVSGCCSVRCSMCVAVCVLQCVVTHQPSCSGKHHKLQRQTPQVAAANTTSCSGKHLKSVPHCHNFSKVRLLRGSHSQSARDTVEKFPDRFFWKISRSTLLRNFSASEVRDCLPLPLG